jgi:hypothetical protein
MLRLKSKDKPSLKRNWAQLFRNSLLNSSWLEPGKEKNKPWPNLLDVDLSRAWPYTSLMFDTVYIVVKSDIVTGHSIFKKVFFIRERAWVYIHGQKDPELFRIETYVPSKRDDGTAKEIY